MPATDKYLYGLIRTWFALLVTNLNSALTTKSITNISRITSTMDEDNLSSMDSDYKYFLKLEDLEIEDSEYENLMVIKCNIEFQFLLGNNDASKYESVIDNILYPLFYRSNNTNGIANLPYSNSSVSTLLKIIRIYDRQLTDLQNIKDGYYVPKLSFKLEVIDV
jgi:hypothetical protein